jgi:NAD(P)-dependent dehydrogenase (short-subunit alcohol dehydrogenase family)
LLLDAQVAVITGAGSERGIGRAIARLFAEAGARVAALDIDGQGAAETARLLGSAHRGYQCDVTQADQVEAVFAQLTEDLGLPSILVNNAGITQIRVLADLTEADYDAVMDVCMRGTFLCSKAAVPYMERRGGGAIVCISSVSAKQGGLFGGPHYCAAKAAVLGFARSLAKALAPEHIRVNAVAPGLIDTDLMHGEITADMKARVVETLIPLGRIGQPEDVANACLFLASPMADWITGEVMDVNGGQYID